MTTGRGGTAAGGGTAPGPAPDSLLWTRRVLHGIAEHVFAAHEFRVTGRIALRVRAHGFTTLGLPGGSVPSRLELVGSTVVVRPGEPGVRAAGQPLGELADGDAAGLLDFFRTGRRRAEQDPPSGAWPA